MSLTRSTQIPLFAQYADAGAERARTKSATTTKPLSLIETAQPPADADASGDAAQPTDPAQVDLRICVIGSGSSGNSSIFQHGQTGIMIDAGFGPRTTANRLHTARLDLSNIHGIVVTHLDRDHFRPSWINTLIYRQLPLWVHRWHADDLVRVPMIERLVSAGLIRWFENEPFSPAEGFTLTAVHLPHDRKGTNGFHIDTPGGCAGYATDLGSVPRDMIERFTDVDILAIESNYDPDMQQGSNRPLHLKRRIMGKQGHLSNQQAYEAVEEIFYRSRVQPQHIVLLHRSQQCNCPQLVKEMFARDANIVRRVTLTEQRRRTRWLAACVQKRAAVARPLF